VIQTASLAELHERWIATLKELGTSWREINAQVAHHENNSVNTQSIISDDEVIAQLATMVLMAWRNDPKTIEYYEAEITASDVEAYFDDHNPEIEQYLQENDLDTIETHAATKIFHTLAKSKTTWTIYSARAEAERLTRLMRCNEYQRHELLETITAKVISLCTKVTADRYLVPDIAENDVRLTVFGGSIFDANHLTLYTSQELLDKEARLLEVTETTTDAHLDHAQAVELLNIVNDALPKKLRSDQIQGALHLLTNQAVISALVGPAGTGKTTTMKAVKECWDAYYGIGTVIGLAPSGRAAAELGDSLGVRALTIDAFLTANLPQAKANRADWRALLTKEYLEAKTPRHRNSLLRQIAKADAV